MSWFDICYFNGDIFGAVFCFDNGAVVQYTVHKEIKLMAMEKHIYSIHSNRQVKNKEGN